MKKIRNAQGFTLIELLIVVVIIGILAAIAIPRFANTKGKAFDAAAKTDLRNAMSAQEGYFADNQSYSSSTTSLNLNPSTGVVVNAAGSAGGYAMSATHTAGGTDTYCVTSADGKIAPC